jgi:8-oxo-dGTP pyrophosphatase MutT (NUDIX family)
MYKVFVNESLLIFSDSQSQRNSSGMLMAKPEETERIVRNLLSGVFSSTDYLIPFSDSETENYLNEHFEIVTAAGGIILNKEGKVLWIFRRGKWDLPKGKADEGESAEETAIREVKEECGIQEVCVKKFLGNAYHIYPITKGKKAVFKTTHWFLMETDDLDFIPQTEEDITEIKFFGVDEKTPLENTFRSLKTFLEDHYLKKSS